MPRTIVIGATVPVPPGRGDLFCMPHETPPDLGRTDVSVFKVRDLDHCLHLLRHIFAEHSTIATLGGAKVIGSSPAWVEAVEKRLAEFLEDLGNCPIDCWKGARNVIANSELIANGSTSRELADSLKGKPAICLGGGPSATPEMLDKIKRLQHSHAVFACDSMMHACQRAGFAPDFVTMIERSPEMARLVTDADPSSILIAPPVIDNGPASHFRRHCWWWGGCDVYRWLSADVAPANLGRSAGTLGLGAAIIAGCNPIYLIGHDLAYSPELKSHCTDVHAYASDTQAEDDEKHKGSNVYNFLRFPVPGWGAEPVTTNGMWNLFRGDIETMIGTNTDRKFISAQNGSGARIAGVEAGSLPDDVPRETIAIALPPAKITPPLSRVPSILMDFERIIMVCRGSAQLLDGAKDPPLEKLANVLTINRLVPGPNANFFRYVFRTVFSSLSLRLNLLVTTDRNPREVQRQALLILCETLPILCERMRNDLMKGKA